jgi:hypothetical protein
MVRRSESENQGEGGGPPIAVAKACAARDAERGNFLQSASYPPPDAAAPRCCWRMLHSGDPLSWIRELGLGGAWSYSAYDAFITVYLATSPRRQAEARSALPGVDSEARVMAVLRSPARWN